MPWKEIARNILWQEIILDDRSKEDEIINSHKIMKKINGPKLQKQSLSMVSRIHKITEFSV